MTSAHCVAALETERQAQSTSREGAARIRRLIRMNRRLGLTIALFCLGCDEIYDLPADSLARSSNVLSLSASKAGLYVANQEQGTVSYVPTGSGPVVTVEVGSLPTRVARTGDRVFVSLRGQRQLAVLSDRDGAPTLETRIDVGAEPYGVVSSPTSNRIYVAVSLEDRVLEIDGGSLAVLRSWNVPGQPRWLAVHPKGQALYVASAYQHRLTAIDLLSGSDRAVALAVPNAAAFFSDREEPFAHRLTGDLATTPFGDQLLVPALVIDTVMVAAPTPVEVSTEPPPPGAYVGAGPDLQRLTPVIHIVPLDPSSGAPSGGRNDQFIAHVAAPGGQVGIPSSVVIDPFGEYGLVTLEGAARGVALKLASLDKNANVGRFQIGQRRTFLVPAGPRGVAFLDKNTAFVYGFLDRTVSRLDYKSFAATFAEGGEFETTDQKETAPENLSAEEAIGRRLFYSSEDERMSAHGSGLSCSGCHAEGRNDGITWTLEGKPRQTPSLAGKISEQAPLRWEGDIPSVAQEAMDTIRKMGGAGVPMEEAAAIQRYLHGRPDVDLPKRGVMSEAATRGRDLFRRDDVGCANCHNGARYTDGKKYAMFGMSAVQTRSLVGVAATAPYLHNGAFETLREVVLNAEQMGARSSQLSLSEIDDLVAYLETL